MPEISLQFAGLLAAVLLQGSVLPVFLPWLPLNPALVALIFLSFSLPRNRVLGLAVWAGFLQDIMYGEVLGLSMLAFYLAISAVREIKSNLLDNAAAVCALRLIVAVLVQELLFSFFFYVRGAGPENLLSALQVNAGKAMFANLLLLGLALLWFKLRNNDYLKGLLEEIV